MNRPPASSTITRSGARSHRFTIGSAATSAAPSATSMCCRSRRRRGVRHTRCSEIDHRLRGRAVLGPRREVGVAELRVREGRHLRHRDRRARSRTHPRRVPRTSGVQRRRRDHAETELAVLFERDQRGPDRHAADVAGGAVDRVDDPASGARAFDPELLAEHGIAGAGRRESGADQLLGGMVRLGHMGRVRLAVDPEVVAPGSATS